MTRISLEVPTRKQTDIMREKVYLLVSTIKNMTNKADSFKYSKYSADDFFINPTVPTSITIDQ